MVTNFHHTDTYQNKSFVFLGNIISWVFVLLCFGYPICAILSVLLNVPSTPISIIYRGICLFLSLYVIIILLSSKVHSLSKASTPLLIFLFIYLLRIIWDTLIVKVNVYYGLLNVYSYYLGSILIPVIGILIAFKFSDVKKTIMRCFYLLIIVNILILLCYFYQNNWSFSSGFFIRRAGLLYKDLDILNPISFGIYGGCLFLSCFCVLVKYKHLFPRLIINAAWFFLIIGLFNLIISTSRGPILSTILTTMVIAFITYSDSKKTFNFYNKILTILFIIFISGTLVLSYISVNNIEIGIFNRFKLMKENSQTGKKETRVDLYSEAFEMFKSSPIIGKRFVTESKYSGGAYPHNIFLEIMMALGLLGLFFFIIIMYNLYKKISSLRRESAYYLFFFCLLVFFFWMAQVTGSLFNNFELWILSATMFSLKNNCDFSEPLFSNKISHTIL